MSACGTPMFPHVPSVFNSLLPHWRGVKNALPSCCVLRPTVTGGECARPLLSCTEICSTVLRSCSCTRAQTSWWSHRRHDKEARSHHFTPVACSEQICTRKWRTWREKREVWELDFKKSHLSMCPVYVLAYFKYTQINHCTITLSRHRQRVGWMEVRDQRIVKERLEPFHTRRFQLSAGSATYCCTHTYLLMSRTPLIHEVLSMRALWLLACRLLKATMTSLFFQEVEPIVCWARFT